ncbi:MAG: hypothetical protein LUF32_01180 [Clostridiales bacterium]|nr:hypothetical protein [Clostridiales bacterium]
MLRLIEGNKTEHPFSHENLPVRFYSMEELCYFMETNMYLIDSSWLGEDLFSWLEKELDAGVLAATLRSEWRKSKDIYACAERILSESGYYDEAGLDRIAALLDRMRGKTKMERRKMRGDLFLDAGKYRKAALTYMELLEEEYEIQMTEELRGNIFHNLGVVYARLFLFPEAARMFAKAYALRKTDGSRDAYLYAMNYVDDSCTVEEGGMDLNFNVMRDALNRLTEAADDPENYAERKEASAAASAFDWKAAQEKLLLRWSESYREMVR